MGKLWFDFKRGDDDINEGTLLDYGTRKGLETLMTQRLRKMRVLAGNAYSLVYIGDKQVADDGTTQKMGCVEFAGGNITPQQSEGLCPIIVWCSGCQNSFGMILVLRYVGVFKNNPDSIKEMNFYKERCRILEENNKELTQNVKDLGTRLLQLVPTKDEKVGIT